MKSLLISGAAALLISSAAIAQNASDAKTTTPAPAASAATTGDMQFIQKQETGQLRAPKLVGVAVYDKDNKSVGKIDDLLMDKDGKIHAVVIGIGGFLGIGKKDVALPYDAVKWQTEQRTAATSGAAPASGAGGTNNNMGGTTTTTNTAAAPAGKTMTPEEQEAYNGYPDRAVVEMSQQQLKDAPEFKYMSQTTDSSGNATTGTMAPAKQQ